ncbi:Type I restriction-modification system, specificity subunit S [Vibrio fluvialis I21563]|uniref:restriction endonuclease subunit S n=1 Tax=Vibrio fluvialis TaxID=676 RepID=UPI0003572C1A|nr:restriction endonuclease subunit S [Vibrio fluvialis]EPP19279.1 Type I restriction-modification system, specificity subunit S [Vibrio fluvialis I21563]
MTTLSEYIKVQGGYAYKSKDFIEFSKNKVLKIKNVRFGTIDYSEPAYVSDELSESTKNWKVKEGDVLISMTGSGPNAPQSLVGRVARVWKNEPDAWINQRVGRICLLDEDSVHLDFIFYWLSLPQSQDYLVSNSSGSANQANISGKTIESLPCPKVDYQTSKQIADLARKFDEKVILNSKTNQTLEEMAQAIFKSWFVDFDPVKAKMNGEQPEGMDAATASLFPDKLVESELGLIPEGWPVDHVGNHIKVTKGKSYKSAELQESTTALVTLKSFKRGGGYRMDGLKEYTGTYKPQQVIDAGDLVMSLTDVTQAAEIVGKPALVIDAPQYDTLVASLDVAILRPKKTHAKQYFYGLMSTYRFHRYAESFASGTTVLHLSPKGITTFEFACPSVELVKKYHEFATPIFAKIEANILESQELSKLRDTLLPKLLSGEIELGQAQELAEVE